MGHVELSIGHHSTVLAGFLWILVTKRALIGASFRKHPPVAMDALFQQLKHAGSSLKKAISLTSLESVQEDQHSPALNYNENGSDQVGSDASQREVGATYAFRKIWHFMRDDSLEMERELSNFAVNDALMQFVENVCQYPKTFTNFPLDSDQRKNILITSPYHSRFQSCFEFFLFILLSPLSSWRPTSCATFATSSTSATS